MSFQQSKYWTSEHDEELQSLQKKPMPQKKAETQESKMNLNNDQMTLNPSLQLGQQTSSSQLTAYYCMTCGKLAFIVNQTVENMFRRRQDESFILNENQQFKLSLQEQEDYVYIQRDDQKIEKQKRFSCEECHCQIGY